MKCGFKKQLNQYTYIIMKRLTLFTALAFVIVTGGQAKVKLPSILADQMVLQQQEKVKLWGSSDRKGKLDITTSWNGQTYQTSISSDGKWEVLVETGKAGGPYRITFDDGDRTQLEDIYLGEVWLCSGQSNMEMPVKGFMGQPVEGSTETIANATPTVPIRMFTVGRTPSKTPQEDCSGNWTPNTPEAAANFSATAYFFGLQLHRSLHVPIGLINSSWGGSSIQAWMTPEALRPYPEISQKHLTDQTKVKHPHLSAAMLYNGMIHPIKEFAFKGVIWYQGESNRENPTQYEALFQDFVKDWRTQFKNDALPLYYVQIAPHAYEDKDATGTALLRQAQYNCETKIPHVGMAVTMDIGNETCIHPAQKKEVGNRLAYLALAQTYGIKGIPAQSPRYASHEIKGNKIILSFDRAPMGVTSFYKPLKCFEIAGKDGNYHPAKARIVNRNRVEVWSEDVQEPASVRYAFRNFAVGDLFGVNGLPVSSFTTEK